MRRAGRPERQPKPWLHASAPVTVVWLCGVFVRDPVLVVVGLLALAVAAVTRAWWEGAREHVVSFGSDSAVSALRVLRRKLGIADERGARLRKVRSAR